MRIGAAPDIKEVLVGAGFRAPTGYPRNARVPIRFMLKGTILDNSTVFVDLTVDVVDINILRMSQSAVPDTTGDAALTPADDPSAVIVIERAAVAFMNPTESPETLWGLVQSAVLVHRPAGGGDIREVPFVDLLTGSGVTAISRDATLASNHTATTLADVVCRPLRLGPFWVNLESDVFGVKPLVAVNGTAAGGTGFALICEGAAFPNAGWLPEDSGASCDNSKAGMLNRIVNALGSRAVLNTIFGGTGPTAKLRK